MKFGGLETARRSCFGLVQRAQDCRRYRLLPTLRERFARLRGIPVGLLDDIGYSRVAKDEAILRHI